MTRTHCFSVGLFAFWLSVWPVGHTFHSVVNWSNDRTMCSRRRLRCRFEFGSFNLDKRNRFFSNSMTFFVLFFSSIFTYRKLRNAWSMSRHTFLSVWSFVEWASDSASSYQRWKQFMRFLFFLFAKQPQSHVRVPRTSIFIFITFIGE